MRLIIVGKSLDRTLPVACLASVTSGEQVAVVSDAAPDHENYDVTGSGIEGLARVVSLDWSDLSSGEAFILAGSSQEQKQIVRDWGEAFSEKPVWLAPGGFAGVLSTMREFDMMNLPSPYLAESPGWIVGGRCVENTVQLAVRKRNLEIASDTSSSSQRAAEFYGRYIPGLLPQDLVNTSLGNMNAIIHPPLALLNATRIENQETWHYWDEGMTPAVARLIDAIDAERIQLIENLGQTASTLLESTLASYAEEGMQGDTFYQAVKDFVLYRKRQGPIQLDSRFLVDDMIDGCSAYEALASRVGTPHETLTAVRSLAETLLGRSLAPDLSAVEALLAYSRDSENSDSFQESVQGSVHADGR